MHTVLRKLFDIAGNIIVRLIIVRIERLLGPVLDNLERIDAALRGHHLVIGLSVVIPDSGLCVRIFRIPYKIRHDRLESAAGYQRIAADLRVLFHDKNLLAVLSGLHRSAHAAGADNDDIIGFFNRLLRLVLNGIVLESIKI